MIAPTDPPQPERLPEASLDVAADRVAKLRELFPEVFREGRVDFDALRRSLGDWVDPGKERFGLSWPGKAACMRVVQQPSVGTLRPDRAESVDFDTTRNLIIEGDNLEVLKLLQRSYHGKVKMIYIDPPYNTGNEFIYSDDYRDGLRQYLRVTGQRDACGLPISTNSEVSGRFHTNWLAMMWPRLFLARNLLTDDGAVFVSIDEHEAPSLRLLLAEVFGEENFVAQIVWKRRSSPPNDKIIGATHEYIVVVARDVERVVLNLRQRGEQQLARYRNPDDHPKGPWVPGDLTANVKGGRYAESLYFPIRNPNTGVHHYPANNGNWRFNREKIERLIANHEIYFGADGESAPKLKRFLADVKDGMAYGTIWDFLPLNTDGSREMMELFGDPATFENPKPTGMIEELIQLGCSKDGLVLDFFAGSGTTGHAVWNMNAQDGGRRCFILVQLPEPTEGAFPTIADITRERVRRAAAELRPTTSGQLTLDSNTGIGGGDYGFRSYRLAPSCFRPWDGDPGHVYSVAKQLELATDNVEAGCGAEDLLAEILLRAGYELTVAAERLTLAGTEVFSVRGGDLLVCVEERLTLPAVEAMAARDPAQIVVLDRAFGGDDALKVNAMQTVRARPNTVLKVV